MSLLLHSASGFENSFLAFLGDTETDFVPPRREGEDCGVIMDVDLLAFRLEVAAVADLFTGLVSIDSLLVCYPRGR